MTNEEVRILAKRLLFARTTLVNNVPFFSRLLLRLKIGIAECNTAYTDMENVVFDPQFAQRLSDEELEFIFLHELLHCALNHCIRGKGLNNLLYNIACDIVVNSMALDILGLKTFCVDGQEVMHLVVNGDEGREYTAEDVYCMLFKASNKEISDFCRFNGIASGGSGGGDSDYELLELLEEKQTFDSHTEWDDIDNTELLKDAWNHYIKSAAEACEFGSGIPKNLQRYFSDFISHTEIDWRQVLHDFISHHRSDYDYCIPDRRFESEIIMPSFTENIYGNTVNNIWLLVDTSGSVSDEELAVVYSEIVSCMNQMDNFSGRLSFFDTQVSDPVEFSNEKELLSIKPTGGGSTSFFSIFRYLRNNFSSEEKPSVIIILTDGYANFPDESAAMNIPVIWIILDNTEKAPWGKSINISL